MTIFGPQAAPNLTDYTIWLRNVMRVPTNYLPDGAPNITYSFDNSLQWVNQDLGQIPGVIGIWSIYAQAVYNLGGHLLAEFCPDQSWSIATASWASGLATITTSTTNTVQVADRIIISGVSPILYMQPGRGGQPVNPNAPIFVSSVIDDTHFQYPVSPNPGTAILAGNAQVSEYFFSRLRQEFKLASFTPGLVSNTSDQGTGVGLVTPQWAAGLGIFALSLMKTPWGRSYNSIAAAYGPNLWGIT